MPRSERRRIADLQQSIRTAERQVGLETLFVAMRSQEEADAFRSRVWHSAACAEYVATTMAALPLAVAELMRLRCTTRVTLRKAEFGFQLTAGGRSRR